MNKSGLVGKIERRLRGIWSAMRGVRHANVDIVDACNLRCPQCPRGTGTIPNTSASMSPEYFEKLCGRFKADGIRSVALFNWTEPFLHKQIARFVEIATRHRLKCAISSNLSLPNIPALEDCFAAGLRELLVSVSGFTNDVQTIYHRNSNIDVVKGHLKRIAENPANAEKTRIKFLRFKYNHESAEPFRRLAEEYGMQFDDFAASGDPTCRADEMKFDMSVPPRIPFIRDAAGKCYFHVDAGKIGGGPAKICTLGAMLTIDCYGKLYLCCDRPVLDEFCLGEYLELSPGDILLKKYLHPECANCTSRTFVKLSGKERRMMKNSLFRE